MMTRFNFDQPPSDREIMKHCNVVKLTLYREPSGDLSGCFELEGSFGHYSDDGSQEGVADGLRLLRELMREFARRSES